MGAVENPPQALEILQRLLAHPDPQAALAQFAFDNPNFSYGAGLILYSLIRHLRPRRIIDLKSPF